MSDKEKVCVRDKERRGSHDIDGMNSQAFNQIPFYDVNG